MVKHPQSSQATPAMSSPPSTNGPRRRWAMRRLRLRRRTRRALPAISVLPTLCTLANLLAGFAAIHFAAREPGVRIMLWEWTSLTFAAALIFLGMFFDAIDGALARLTRSTSELGGQLDSLADVVTFGIAPAFIMLRLVQNSLAGTEGWLIGPDADGILGRIIWAAAAVYVSCAALRLARFNAEMGRNTVNDHSLFRGLPSPGAAGTVASLVILHQHLMLRYGGGVMPVDPKLETGLVFELARWGALLIPLATLLCAFAMVSNIPYIHFANRYFRGRRNFAYIVRIVIILALVIWWFQEMLALGFVVYALSGPARLLSHRVRHRRTASPA